MKATKAEKDPPEAPPYRSVMVRSLRRRLWKALQEEDVATALRAYTATKDDYEQWLDEEIQEEQRSLEEKTNQKQKERRPIRSMSFRKKGLTRSPSARWTSSCTLVASDPRKTQFLDATYKSKLPILETLLHPNDPFERDDFFSPQDSYDTALLLPPPPPPKEKPPKPKRRGPRLAGFVPWRNGSRRYDWNLQSELERSGQDSKEEVEKVDETMTTLMHEATRIACPDFVRLVLRRGGNPNVRNGQSRTALHMVAGGLLKQEYKSLQTENDVGIPVPVIDLNDETGDDKDERRMHKKAARAVGRLLQKLTDAPRSDEVEGLKPRYKAQTDDDKGRLSSQRMDTLLAVLSWVHVDDGSPSSGEGPTINSVDSRGRTALHYAAELGRSDLCLAILTSFGAILTIVDESGQTPGELAAIESHPELAAQLEARALLYIDPYGLDEELMASVWGGSSDDAASSDGKRKKRERSARSKLAPPFAWFETWTMDKVRKDWNDRTKKLLKQMQETLATKQEDKEATEFMYNHGIDDSSDERTLNSDQAVTFMKMAKTHVNSADAQVEVELPESFLEEAASKFAVRVAKEMTSKNDNLLASSGDSKKSETDSDDERRTSHELHLENPELVSPLKNGESISVNEDGSVDEADKTPMLAAARLRLQESRTNRPLSEFQLLSRKLRTADVHRYAAFHAWDIAECMQAFQNDPCQALKEAGVEIDCDASLEKRERDSTSSNMCLICCDEIEEACENWVDLAGCAHGFCSECLGDYVAECSRSKETGVVMDCPHHECHVPLSFEEVKQLAPSKDVYDLLLQTSDENFVAVADDLGFCPHPGCVGVVRRILPSFVASGKLNRNLLNLAGAVCTLCSEETQNDKNCPLTYEGVPDRNYLMTRNSVQPKRAHRFCFSCGSDHVHWPVQCETLDLWKEKIVEEIGELEEGEEGDADNGHFNDVAQRLWMKANTRPCPKCKAPIEKNDGCNHMTCSNRNCRHEFCWICREDWKLHNTETGGFFRCNRWQEDDNHKYYDTPPPPEQRVTENNASEGVSSAEVNYGTSLHSSRVAWKKSKEMGLFLHHYRRWTAHSESAALERAMADTACSRLSAVVEAAIDLNGTDDFDFGGKGLSFVHAAFTELLECRSLLQHSYVFSYFRYPIQYHIRRSRSTKSKEREKSSFEQIQSELEMLTEQMSDIVARKHLRATQMQIMFLTTGACQKRTEFTSFMLSLLNEQLKEAKEEAERTERDKDRSPVDQTPQTLGSIFDFASSREIGSRLHHHNPYPEYPFQEHPRFQHQRDHMSTRLRLLMDAQRNRRGPFYDSDDDDFHFRPGRAISLPRGDEESNHDAIRASVQAFFQMGSDDFRHDGEMPGRFQDWACVECTYMNAGGRACAMCGSGRR